MNYNFLQDLNFDIDQSIDSPPFTNLDLFSDANFSNFDQIKSEQLDLPPSSLDDKRRRNTAASARFRIKKKLKEQQMDNQLKLLQQKVDSLQLSLKQYEMENKCLKSLLLQNNEKRSEIMVNDIRKSVLK